MMALYTEFDIVQKMLVGTHMSGFSWDPEKLCVIADDQVWDMYIKILPCAAQFRRKPFPQYNKLHSIFVKDTTKVEDIVQENQIIPCLEGKEVHGSASSFNRDKEIILPCAAQFRRKPFPQYNKLHSIFVKDTTKVKVEDIVQENQIIPCLEGKEVHDSASSFNRDKEIVSSKRNRTEGNDLNGNCVKSKVVNQGINAANDIMGKVASQIKDLPRLKLDERLLAMSVIGRSEPHSVMFDQLDEEGKVRMAEMVAVGAIN
ncbi:hypothetical protein CTI12_AA046200 [Artemisia annua]|uniref:Myb/SANT-like domain-containing protein n=1 Tax=Artemisia annua TaxID=35608 RepID=A0A2U1QCG2_ARTAN|nr:hypothetical protein CTI12_AA046200 [Artemisia annua]